MRIENEKPRLEWIRNAIASLPAGSRLLDAGAGEQRFRADCKHLRYISQDFGHYNPATLDAGMQMKSWDYGKLDIVCDITNIPEPDASFDAILCIEVLEHIPSPQDALREFARLLKPGGTLILTAPFCSLTHFAPHHHCTGFSRFFYEKWLPELGFSLAELNANGSYFQYIGQEVNRLPDVCKKYSKPVSWLTRAAIQLMLFALSICEKADRGSSELLCFGYFVKAIRS